MSPYTGKFANAGLAKEGTRGTFTAPTRFVNYVPPFDFSPDIQELESQGVSGIADMVTKYAQGPGQLKAGKIKFEMEPENSGEHFMAAFGTDTVTETASFIVILNTNDTIDFVCTAGTEAATVAAGTYVAGANSGTDAAGTLCKLIASAMHTADSAHTYTVTFSTTTNKFTIATSQASGTFSLLFNSGTNAAKTMAPLLGFSTAADQTGAYTYTAGTAVVAVFSHAFTRAQTAQLPSYSWWKMNAGLDYEQFTGCLLSKLELDIKAKEFVEVSADWIGLKGATSTSQSQSYSTHNAFKFDQVVPTVAGSPVADYDDIKLTIDNMGENVHTIGSSIWATKNYSKGFKVSLSMTITVENTTEWAKFIAGTPSSVTITMTSIEAIKATTYFSLTLTMTNVVYKGAPRPLGKDLLKITFTSDATSSINSSTTLTATLVNSIGVSY